MDPTFPRVENVVWNNSGSALVDLLQKHLLLIGYRVAILAATSSGRGIDRSYAIPVAPKPEVFSSTQFIFH